MPRRKQRLLITGLICAVCVAVLLIVLLQGSGQVVRFTPPPFEETAVRSVDFPVSKDSGQTGGMITYAVALPEGVRP